MKSCIQIQKCVLHTAHNPRGKNIFKKIVVVRVGFFVLTKKKFIILYLFQFKSKMFLMIKSKNLYQNKLCFLFLSFIVMLKLIKNRMNPIIEFFFKLIIVHILQYWFYGTSIKFCRQINKSVGGVLLIRRKILMLVLLNHDTLKYFLLYLV